MTQATRLYLIRRVLLRLSCKYTLIAACEFVYVFKLFEAHFVLQLSGLAINSTEFAMP